MKIARKIKKPAQEGDTKVIKQFCLLPYFAEEFVYWFTYIEKTKRLVVHSRDTENECFAWETIAVRQVE